MASKQWQKHGINSKSCLVPRFHNVPFFLSAFSLPCINWGSFFCRFPCYNESSTLFGVSIGSLVLETPISNLTYINLEPTLYQHPTCLTSTFNLPHIKLKRLPCISLQPISYQLYVPYINLRPPSRTPISRTTRQYERIPGLRTAPSPSPGFKGLLQRILQKPQ